MRKFSLFISSLAVLAFIACGGNKENNSCDSPAPTIPAEEATCFKSTVFEIHKEFMMDESDPNSAKLTIDISLPLIGLKNNEASKRTESIITQTAFQNSSESETTSVAANEMIENAKKDFHLVKTIYNEKISQGYHKEIFNRYYYIKGTADTGYNGYINYVLYREEFLGGAHPNSETTALNISPKTGNDITLEDIFKEESMEELTEMIKNGIAGYFGVATFQDVTDMGLLFNSDIYVSNNFILGKDTTTFIYNMYDIAPRAAGEISAKIPNDKIRHLMK